MSIDHDTRVVTHLGKGSHRDPVHGLCFMEAAAYLAGEHHSTSPKCVSTTIAVFGRMWNDALDDADRNRILLPLVRDVIGTRVSDRGEIRLAWMAIDWLVRVNAPAWMDLTPDLRQHAKVLRSLARIEGGGTRALSERNSALYAALYAALKAPWGSALDVHAAALDAAWGAAWVVALESDRDSARNASLYSAWAAAATGADMRPTVLALQVSAADLLRAMCAEAKCMRAEEEA